MSDLILQDDEIEELLACEGVPGVGELELVDDHLFAAVKKLLSLQRSCIVRALREHGAYMAAGQDCCQKFLGKFCKAFAERLGTDLEPGPEGGT